jgi:hypothetical protein
VSGEPDDESSRRRVLALLLAGLLALLGAGAGVSNFFTDDGDDGDEDGVDLSVDYTVTPDDPTPTPTPTPGGRSSADEATDPPEQPDATTGTDTGSGDDPAPTDVPIPYDADDPAPAAATTATPGDDLVTASIPPVSVENVEPGDGGTGDLSLTLSGSPARLWVRGDVTAVDEGGTTEVERSAGDTGEPGELQDYVQVQVWYDADGDGTADADEPVVYEGTLAGLGAAGDDDGWIPLTTTCSAPGTHVATLRWTLPSDAPNTVQTDGVSFSLGVAADTSGCA